MARLIQIILPQVAFTAHHLLLIPRIQHISRYLPALYLSSAASQNNHLIVLSCTIGRIMSITGIKGQTVLLMILETQLPFLPSFLLVLCQHSLESLLSSFFAFP